MEPIVIHAAGGLVRNEKNQVLFMFRRGVWDLPKGKLDAGETLEECALREVREETGLAHLRLGEFLLTTYHDYAEKGQSVRKAAHWWTMEASSAETLVPQAEEDITELAWMGPEDFHAVKANTFPTILAVLRKGGYPV